MSIKSVVKSAHRQISELSSVEFRTAVFLCIAVAALNALFLAYSFGYVDGDHASGCSGRIARDYSYDLMRLKIELALLVICITLRFRTVLWFCISLLATVLIEIQYALWYLDTQRWFRDVKLTDFSQLKEPGLVPHFAGIYQATPWDFVLFAFATALFAWQVRVTIAIITTARRRK